MKPIHIGIDACNISSGGGVTHLSRILQYAKPTENNIDKVTLWTSTATAKLLPDQPWLNKQSPAWIEGNPFQRIIGQQIVLDKLVKNAACDVLFCPGGTLPLKCSVPKVTMSQNMLPFEPNEALLFGRRSWMRLKMRLLRSIQGFSFNRADGLIFLTKYAFEEIKRQLGGLNCSTRLVPHGIETRFVKKPRLQVPFSEITSDRPFRLLYVSILMPYKRQVEVLNAVTQLNSDGYPVDIHFVGASWGDYGEEFGRQLNETDPQNRFSLWSGFVDFEELHQYYHEADGFVFASSCENLPNIMIEAMAAGLPIACSNRGPMPEILEDAGKYFDPESPDSIAEAILALAKDHSLREKLAESAFQKAQKYSWENCADKTFEFIADVARQHMR